MRAMLVIGLVGAWCAAAFAAVAVARNLVGGAGAPCERAAFAAIRTAGILLEYQLWPQQ